MTAAVDTSAANSGVSEVLARMQAIQTQLTALRTGVVPSGTTSATSTTSAAQFASALSSMTGTSTYSSGAATASTGSTGGAAIVADASKYLGVPYVWGGESTSGMDCSGLVQQTFKDLGVSLPRTAAEQQQVGTPVASLADAQPGDLLFFGDPAYHVAIYAGDGKLIESPEPGKTVHVTSVYQTPTSIRHVALPGATAAGDGSALQAAGISAAVAGYASQFAAAEQANGLPSGLLAAVCQQESGGNSRAVSAAGAQGLMQLMPSTAAGMGVDAFDPTQAIGAAGRILGRNLREFGSVPLALAAYNAGAGAVQQYGGVPPYAETQNYVRRITAMLAAGG